jgi:electron transfer flavoprotein beta subunit
MKVVACYKIVPDDRDITVKADRTLDTSKAELKLGDYDLNAMEESAVIAEATGGTASILTVGTSQIDNSKLIKAALSRGASDLHMVIGEATAQFDAHDTAATLAAVLTKIGYDLVLCGEGSADLYAQQVGNQLGELLDVPCFNSVSKITPQDASIRIERTLENEVEILEVQLPAVISVTPDINLPRIPQLKEILAAGKKEVVRYSLDDLGITSSNGIKVISTLAPESAERKHIILEGASAENIDAFVQNLKREL